MGRILDKDKYKIDTKVSLDDYVIGSDSDNLNKTVNFSINSIMNIINESNNISTITYNFTTLKDPITDTGYFSTNQGVTELGLITELTFSKVDSSGNDNTDILNLIKNKASDMYISIKKPLTDVIQYLNILSFVETPTSVTFTVSNVGSAFNGVLEEDVSYVISYYVKASNQDNKPLFINFGYAWSFGAGVVISNFINNLPQFTVAEDQIVVFEGIVAPQDRSSTSYNIKYLLNNLGKGTYGKSGTQLTDNDLKEISRELLTQGINPSNDPNANVIDFGEIGNTDFLTLVNTHTPAYVIQAGTNWYFEYTNSGKRVLYGFSGSNGNYGQGNLQMTSNDIFLIYSEVNPAIPKNTSDLINDGEIAGAGDRFIPESEKHTFANDITLSAYPNTRNDGILPTNKVLSTDVNGALKLYNTPMVSAPFLENLIPDNTHPSTTGDIHIWGDFFTEVMCDRTNNPNAIILQGQTINTATFVNSQHIIINVTTGATEGLFDLTLDNGISKTFTDALQIVLGTVFKPTSADWINVLNLDISTTGEAKLITFNSVTSGIWNKQIDFTKNWELDIRFKRSPLGFYVGGNNYNLNEFSLIDATTQADVYNMQVYYNAAMSSGSYRTIASSPNSPNINLASLNLIPFGGDLVAIADYIETVDFKIKHINGVLYSAIGGTNIQQLPLVLSSNLLLKVNPKFYDFFNIKYIELL